MVSTRRNLNNQTASAKPEIVNSGRIAKKRRSNGPQKRLSTHIKNIIVDKCLRKESMKKAGVARMFGVSWQTVDRRKVCQGQNSRAQEAGRMSTKEHQDTPRTQLVTAESPT